MLEKIATSQADMTLYGQAFTSRLLLGTARYPSPKVLSDSVAASGAEIVTVSLRRESARGQDGQRFWDLIDAMGVRVLPNTAGCRTVKEAVTTAQMARELFDTSWIKLEVIANTIRSNRMSFSSSRPPAF